MTHTIALNYDTDLSFKAHLEVQPTIVSKVAYSVEQAKFIDIERTRFLGYVEVSSPKGDTIATIDGQATTDEVVFAATETTNPEGTVTLLWNVYTVADKEEDDIDIEDVPSSDIPDAVVDMLL